MPQADPVITRDAERPRAPAFGESHGGAESVVVAVDPTLDRIAGWVGRLLGVSSAFVYLSDRDRPRLVRRAGGWESPTATGTGPRLIKSMCRQVIARGEALVVRDARELPRRSPVVRRAIPRSHRGQERGLGAYLGVPFRLGTAHAVLCAVHDQPRDWTEHDREILDCLVESLASVLPRASAPPAPIAPGLLADFGQDVRTPLALILGHAELLLDPDLDRSLREKSAQSVLRQGQELLVHVENLLDHAALAADDLELAVQPCSPWSVLEEIAALVNDSAGGPSEDLVIQVEGRVPCRVATDPPRLRRILRGLVGHALESATPGQPVRLRAFAECPTPRAGSSGRPPRGRGPSLVFEVTPRETAETSEPLNSSSPPIPRPPSALISGGELGLRLAQRLAERLQGQLTVASGPGGRGRTLTLRLPIAAEAPGNPWIDASESEWVAAGSTPREHQRPHPRDATPGRPSPRGARVLVVDDDPDLRRLMHHQLTRAGLMIDLAENGLAAVELARAGAHDAILMDMQMPVLDGCEAVRLLRGSGYARPIIALTAHARGGHRDRCLCAGCDDYLVKPILVPTLLDALSRCLQESPPAGSARSSPPRQATSPSHPLAMAMALAGLDPSDPGLGGLVSEYVKRMRDQVHCVRAALREGDRGLLTELAHRCKGVAPMYGFGRLGELAGRIEAACREHEDLEILQELVADYLAEIEAIPIA